MKKRALGVIALFATAAAPVLAADLPVKAAPMVPRVFDWTGCYAGVHAGGGRQASSETTFGVFGGVGALGGLQGGCNYQIRQFVIGLEAEFWGSSLADRSQDRDGFFTHDQESRNRWDAAVSARAGLAMDNAYLYGKLGVVWGKFDYSHIDTDTPDFRRVEQGSAIFPGVLIGVGLEYALTANWTAKFEYNYIDYGNRAVTFTEVLCDPDCVTSVETRTVKEVKQLAKIGLNYKFGEAGARAAFAAALPVKGAAVPRAFDWTGCYVGVHAGAGWQGSSFTSEAVRSGVGAVGGGQAGCNYQWKRFVIGIEGEVWGSTLYDRDSFVGATTSSETNSKNRWDAALSVRSGVAFDRAFAYGKVGAVWGRFDYDDRFTAPGFTTSSRGSADFVGVLLGVGFEYALTDNWTAKFEYNYIDYGNRLVSFAVTCDPACPDSTSSRPSRRPSRSPSSA